jgi:hypothetical protein
LSHNHPRGTVCPLCGKTIRKPLNHYRLSHDIEDTEEFLQALEKIQVVEERKAKFAQYVDELNNQKAKGLITAEDWRRLVREWARSNE